MNTNFFEKFVNTENKEEEVNNEVWIYTRVSSKDQETNNSLLNQKEYAEKYAKTNNLVITKRFGHTYESARGDFTRKEFKKLIDEIRSTKKRPFALLIYIMSRFSRSGGNSIGLVNEFRELGVHIIETFSGVGTQTEMGEFQVYQKLLEARKENMDRLKSTLPGMKRFIENGNYLGNIPRGYTLYGSRTTNFELRAEKQKIIINEDGKILKKAWKWKATGERDFVIREKLEKLGLKIAKQTMSSMWKNPTYCGVSTNKLLDKPVKGNWPKIVSEDNFIKIQRIIDTTGRSGYKVNKTNKDRPLTRHLICSECSRRMTSYEIKKKGVHYYKCQKCSGVSINANTTKRSLSIGAHEMYIKFLSKYELKEVYSEPLKLQLKKTLQEMIQEDSGQSDDMKKHLEKLKIKKMSLADKFVDELIDADMYKKMKAQKMKISRNQKSEIKK